MHQESAQKLLIDAWYPESVVKEFKNFSLSLDDLMTYSILQTHFTSCILIKRRYRKTFTHRYTNITVKQKIIKISIKISVMTVP